MKKKITKIIATLMCLTMLGSSLVGCGENIPELPDYSGNTDRFEFLCYRAPNDGHFYIDDLDYYNGETFQTVERYKEMLDCGFTVLYNNQEFDYANETWENSKCKKVFELAYEAGFKKIITRDSKINSIIDSAATVYEPSKADPNSEDYDPTYVADASKYTYASVEALNKEIKDILSKYAEMPGFGGMVLMDEPNYKKAVTYGHVYRAALKAAEEFGIKDFYIHANFLPSNASSGNYGYACTDQYFDDQLNSHIEECTTGGYHTYEEMYYNYLASYVEEANLPRISADTYLFRGYGMCTGFYPSLQVIRQVATDYNVELSYCLQSYHGYSGSSEAFARCDKSMMYLEMNSLLGFGASNFAYYTYMPHTETSSTGAKDMADGSFLNRKGEKNQVWYYGQQIMSELQQFAPVILSYDFKGAKMYTNTTTLYGLDGYMMSYAEEKTGTMMQWDNGYSFNLLKNLKLDNDIALVTELKDKKNDLYMYMVQNIIDPRNGTAGRTDMNVEVDFGTEYTYVAEFDCGNLRYVPLENGVYKNALSAGYAVYLVPLK